MTPGTIFVSHRAEYGSLVRELKRAIETTSRGQIRVFISEDLPGAEKWRAAIKSSLQSAESLFLVYGAAYEDWSWCFYEAGFFSGVDTAQKQSRPIYCIARPNVPAPGPLSDLQMVTDSEQLIKTLIEIYDRNKVDYEPIKLREFINKAAMGLFRKLEEFFSYPRVYFAANDSEFGDAGVIPTSSTVRGDKTYLTQLFGIGRDIVRWDELTKAIDDRTPQEQMFFDKWADETKKIIIAAREHRFMAPQTVLVARGGLRVRFLLYQARTQGDGTYWCEFLVVNEVGGPVLGSKRQMLALLTSVRLGFRFRYELIKRFDHEPDTLSEADRRARILEIPRIIDNLTAESESRGNITLEDLQGAFDNEDDADRIGKLVGYWPFLREQLYSGLGLSADGTPVSDQGLIGPNLQRYRLAFESLRLLNLEFLSLCCARVSRLMLRTPEELKKNAEVLEGNVRTLSGLLTKSAA